MNTQITDQTSTSSIVEEYHRNGFAVLRDVIDADLIAEAREHVEWLQQRYTNLRPEHFHHPLMRDDAFWVRLVTDDRLLDIAEQVLGPDLACFTSHYICKPPLHGQPVLWHQDGAYWNLEPMEALTIWLAIDDSSPDNGCLRMIPGSHRRGIEEVVMRSDVANMLHSSIDPSLVDVQQAVDVVLRPGDVSIHHPKIIHGSEPNRSARRRCGLDIGYIRTSTRIGDTGLYLNPLLVRGSVVPGVNRYRPWAIYHPDQTIAFRDHEKWSEQAQERNCIAGLTTASSNEPSVIDLAMRMIERLQKGTTRVSQVSTQV